MDRDGRASVIGVHSPTPHLLPNPGGPTQVRRQFVALCYVDIAAGLPPVPQSTTFITWNTTPTAFVSYNNETNTFITWNVTPSTFTSWGGS